MYVRRATRAADPAYRCVQPRPAPRNRRQEHLRRRVTLPGNDPASTTGQDSPTPGLLSLSAAAASSCTCCLPAMRLPGTSPQTRATGQRRNHPGPAPPDANAPDRSRPARERPRHKSRSNRPIVRICRNECFICIHIYVRAGILTHALGSCRTIAVHPFHCSGRKSDRFSTGCNAAGWAMDPAPGRIARQDPRKPLRPAPAHGQRAAARELGTVRRDRRA
jgi:hypothetical protein